MTRGIPRLYSAIRWTAASVKMAVVGRPRDAEAVADVVARLLGRQRPDVAAQPDALPELAQLGQCELVPQLGLADQQDLQELRGGASRSSRAGAPAPGWATEVLRLVDDEHGAQPLPVPLDQELVEREQALGVAGRPLFTPQSSRMYSSSPSKARVELYT